MGLRRVPETMLIAPERSFFCAATSLVTAAFFSWYSASAFALGSPGSITSAVDASAAVADRRPGRTAASASIEDPSDSAVTWISSRSPSRPAVVFLDLASDRRLAAIAPGASGDCRAAPDPAGAAISRASAPIPRPATVGAPVPCSPRGLAFRPPSLCCTTPYQMAKPPTAQNRTAPSGLAMNRPVASRTFIVPPGRSVLDPVRIRTRRRRGRCRLV